MSNASPNGNFDPKPSPPSSVLGREREVSELTKLLSSDNEKLITITGPGGIGKTTLSLKVAEHLHASNFSKHCFVDLANAQTSQGICHVVAQVLQLDLAGRDDIEQIGHALKGRSENEASALLVILDNLEQCQEHAAPILTRWRALAPDVHFLTTSRILLGIQDELEYPLEPLSLESSRDLFLLHAKHAQRNFEPDDSALAVIEKITSRLDGIPLAIELAAARLRVLTPQQILERLDQRFALLRSSGANHNPRHATLHNTITWSWDLLSPAEQDAFAQLSLFSQGFELAATEATVDLSAYPEEFTIDVIQRLVEKNLLRDREQRSQRIFFMYESIRDFAREKFNAMPYATQARQRWRTWLLDSCQPHWESRQKGEDPIAWQKLSSHLGALVEIANDESSAREERAWATIYAATLLVGQGGAEVPTRLIRSCLGAYGLEIDQDISEINLDKAPQEVHWLTMLLAQFTLRHDITRAGELIDLIPTNSPALFDALIGLVTTFHRQRDVEGMEMCVNRLEMIENASPYQQARIKYFKATQETRLKGAKHGLMLFEKLLSDLREIGARRLESFALMSLGRLYEKCGDQEQAIHYHQLALEANQDIQHRNNEAACLGELALLYARKQHWRQATEACERALIIDRELGNRFGHAHRLMVLGLIYLANNDLDSSIDMAQRALTLYQSLQYSAGISLAQGLCGMVWAKRALGNDLTQAARSSHTLENAIGFFDEALNREQAPQQIPAEYFYAMARCLEANNQPATAAEHARMGSELRSNPKAQALLFEPDLQTLIEHGERIQQGAPLVQESNPIIDVALIGESQSTHKLRTLITKAAGSDIDVLILGETGSGKELVARAIHSQSTRANKRFVAINCGALPANLFESELFGHEQGAFTGADATKVGLMEHANNGTLFLDEIAEMPIAMQVKLLRALQERKIRRVGGHKEVPINIRVIAATMKSLKQAISEKRFREDLYYRIKVLQLNVPSLRKRREDIIPLAKHFLEQLDQQNDAKQLSLGNDIREKLETYTWPGNVRELYNVMRHAHTMATTKVLQTSDLPELLDTPQILPDLTDAGPLLAETLSERKKLIELLTTHKGNVSAATKASGIDRRTFYRMLERHGLEAASFRQKKR